MLQDKKIKENIFLKIFNRLQQFKYFIKNLFSKNYAKYFNIPKFNFIRTYDIENFNYLLFLSGYFGLEFEQGFIQFCTNIDKNLSSNSYFYYLYGRILDGIDANFNYSLFKLKKYIRYLIECKEYDKYFGKEYEIYSSLNKSLHKFLNKKNKKFLELNKKRNNILENIKDICPGKKPSETETLKNIITIIHPTSEFTEGIIRYMIKTKSIFLKKEFFHLLDLKNNYLNTQSVLLSINIPFNLEYQIYWLNFMDEIANINKKKLQTIITINLISDKLIVSPKFRNLKNYFLNLSVRNKNVKNKNKLLLYYSDFLFIYLKYSNPKLNSEENIKYIENEYQIKCREKCKIDNFIIFLHNFMHLKINMETLFFIKSNKEHFKYWIYLFKTFNEINVSNFIDNLIKKLNSQPFLIESNNNVIQSNIKLFITNEDISNYSLIIFKYLKKILEIYFRLGVYINYKEIIDYFHNNDDIFSINYYYNKYYTIK